MTSSVVGSTTTAVGTAFIVSFGNCAGATAPYILSTQYTKTGAYAVGSYAIMAIIFFGVILTVILHLWYPYAYTLKQAEDEDMRSGYGNELATLNTGKTEKSEV